MRSLVQRRPSASMVVALVALVMACSGTAVAATSLVNGNRLIRKGTLSGNRLRRHTLTGAQINLRRLGTVPKAHAADTAGYAASAGSASSAANAANATNAGNASALGGRPASGYLTTGDRVGTDGTTTMAGSASGTTSTLFTSGPFTVTMTCTTTTAGSITSTAVSVNATSSESNWVFVSSTGLPADTAENLGKFAAKATAQVDGGFWTFEAPGGAGLIVNGSFGTNSAGVNPGCWANFAGID